MADDRKSAALPYLLALVLVLVLYVLSSGPVMRYGDNVFGRDNTRWFYTPVVCLYAFTPLGVPLRWYWEMWGVG